MLKQAEKQDKPLSLEFSLLSAIFFDILANLQLTPVSFLCYSFLLFFPHFLFFA